MVVTLQNLSGAPTVLHVSWHSWDTGPQYGHVAVSALGSGCACPTAVIAFCPSCQCLDTRPQYGQIAVSLLGFGRACPATVIAFCPWCQCSALPMSVRRANAHPLTLPPLSTWALQGYAYIPDKGIRPRGRRVDMGYRHQHEMHILCCGTQGGGKFRLGKISAGKIS